MAHLRYLNYNDKHLASLFRILSEYELVDKDRPRAHNTLKAGIKAAMEKDYHARFFAVNKTEFNYLFRIYSWRITQLNQNKLLHTMEGLLSEIKELVDPLQTLDERKFKTLSILLDSPIGN